MVFSAKYSLCFMIESISCFKFLLTSLSKSKRIIFGSVIITSMLSSMFTPVVIMISLNCLFSLFEQFVLIIVWLIVYLELKLLILFLLLLLLYHLLAVCIVIDQILFLLFLYHHLLFYRLILHHLDYQTNHHSCIHQEINQ